MSMSSQYIYEISLSWLISGSLIVVTGITECFIDPQTTKLSNSYILGPKWFFSLCLDLRSQEYLCLTSYLEKPGRSERVKLCKCVCMCSICNGSDFVAGSWPRGSHEASVLRPQPSPHRLLPLLHGQPWRWVISLYQHLVLKRTQQLWWFWNFQNNKLLM